MIKVRLARIKLLLATSAMMFAMPLFAAPVTYAQSSPPTVVIADSVGDACAGIGLTGGNCKNNGDGLSTVIKAIINILSAIVGVAAVIMIVIGGFRYITSGGEANKVSSAKNTIIYAIVGLIVVALAEFMVHFVIMRSS